MSTWVEKIADRNRNIEKNVPWWVNDKAKLHQFATDNQIPMPKVYQFWETPDDLRSLDALPQKFVLKPTVMHSNWGVQLIEKLEDGSFYDSLNNQTYQLQGVQKVQQTAYDKCNYKGQYKLMAEEFVESDDPAKPVPFDYKVYCFFDRPMLIQQVDRNGARDKHAFFDGKFSPLPEGQILSDWAHIDKGNPVVPFDSETVLDIAIRTTTLLNTPFMRVDMFAGKNGTVLGELTPSPGPLYYRKVMRLSDDLDAKLGRAWADAEDRIAQKAP